MNKYQVEFTKIEYPYGNDCPVVYAVLTIHEWCFNSVIDWICGRRKTPYLIFKDRIVLDTFLGNGSFFNWVDAAGLLSTSLQKWLAKQLKTYFINEINTSIRKKHFG